MSAMDLLRDYSYIPSCSCQYAPMAQLVKRQKDSSCCNTELIQSLTTEPTRLAATRAMVEKNLILRIICRIRDLFEASCSQDCGNGLMMSSSQDLDSLFILSSRLLSRKYFTVHASLNCEASMFHFTSMGF